MSLWVKLRVKTKPPFRFRPVVEGLEERLNPGVIKAPPAVGPVNGGSGGTYNVVAYGVRKPNNGVNDLNKTNFISRDVRFTATGYIDIVYDVTNWAFANLTLGGIMWLMNSPL